MTMRKQRFGMVECPACQGEGGEWAEEYTGVMGYGEAIMAEVWATCGACDGEGRVRWIDLKIAEREEARQRVALLRPAGVAA